MPQNIHTPIEGARCLAAPDGYWTSGRIHRVNEDGTFTIEFDEKDMMIMPYWYGVTPDQVSVNDESHWPDVFAHFTADSSTMTRSAFENALAYVGYCFDDDQFTEFWEKQCKELFGMNADARDTTLNSDQAYQLLLCVGCAAKQFVHHDTTEANYYKLYWNQTRMAGRQPSDISRPVTLDDAFHALGISQPIPDAASIARLEAFQNNNIKLPSNLHRFLCCTGISDAVAESHPNNPGLVIPGDDDFEFQRELSLEGTDVDYALTIMVPHQGNHIWVAAFNRGDTDAGVYVSWDEEHWLLTAPTIGMFFLDLAQTGLIWYQNTRFRGGKPVESTDIGLIPRQARKKWWRFWE